MANKIKALQPAAVSRLIASQVVASSSGTTPTVEDLAAAISDVQIETQTLGASLLVVTLIDPGWQIQRSGFLNITSEGLLDEIDVNFPQGSGYWWRLAMVEGTNDLSAPNLMLTFQDRIISYLQDKWGPKGVAPGTVTRAQFIKQLVDEVGNGDGLQPIKFVCPGVNQLQPVQTQALTNLGTTTVLDGATATAKANKTNKAPGLTLGSKFTIKGASASYQQIQNLNTALALAVQLGANQVATEALVCAGIAESGWQNIPNTQGSDYWGVLQGNKSTFAIDDVTGMVTSFLKGGNGFQAGGAINLALTVSDPGVIAYRVEGDLSNFNGDTTKATSFYSQWLPEAQTIMATWGSTTQAVALTSDVSQLTRGTSDNPDESSWDCIQRLAQEVNWSAFSNGDTLYYMDGPTLAAQAPSVYLSLDKAGTTWTAKNPPDGDTAANVVSNLTHTFDNTAFLYQATRKKKGKVQRTSRIRTPQTPSRVKLNLLCGVLDYRAGDVISFQNSGVINGRWIVEDTTRNTLADTFTQLTLGPPTAPNLEPAATTKGFELSGSTGLASTASSAITSPGTATGAVQAAQIALSQQQANPSLYQYLEQVEPARNAVTSGLFGPAPRVMDCSKFVTLCYKAAGLPDPNHQGYNPFGNTGSLIAQCNITGNPQPGDLAFYGPSTSNTLHVTIYVGGGQVISMGRQGDPSQGPTAAMGPSGFLGYWHPTVLDAAPPSGFGVTVPQSPVSPGVPVAPLPSLWGSP